MCQDVAREREAPEVHVAAREPIAREQHEERAAHERPPSRVEEPALEGDHQQDDGEEEERVQVVRTIVAEEREPAGEQDRKARGVARVEPAVVPHVGLGEDVGARRQPAPEGLAGRPVVEDAAVQEVVREGRVAELVDREIPRDLLVEGTPLLHEQHGEHEPPHGGERDREQPALRGGGGRRHRSRRRAGFGTATRGRHAPSLHRSSRARQKRVQLAAATGRRQVLRAG